MYLLPKQMKSYPMLWKLARWEREASLYSDRAPQKTFFNMALAWCKQHHSRTCAHVQCNTWGSAIHVCWNPSSTLLVQTRYVLFLPAWRMSFVSPWLHFLAHSVGPNAETNTTRYEGLREQRAGLGHNTCRTSRYSVTLSKSSTSGLAPCSSF